MSFDEFSVTLLSETASPVFVQRTLRLIHRASGVRALRVVVTSLKILMTSMQILMEPTGTLLILC